MASTSIEWCDAVWNPVTGCTKVSQGCRNCYAEVMARRLRGMAATGSRGAELWKDRDFSEVRIHMDRLEQPLHWKRPRRVFVNSMSDLFHEDVPELFILETLAIMALTPHITYLVLTKRPEQARQILGQDKDWAEVLGDAAFLATHNDEAECFVANAISGASKPRGGPMGWPLPNLWLGVSVEDQETADVRIPLLLQTPAAVRFVSAEPLLGPIDLIRAGLRPEWKPATGNPPMHPLGTNIDWVIVGGESGPWARPCDTRWVRSIVSQCTNAGVPVFVKQLGGHPCGQRSAGSAVQLAKIHLHDRKGADMSEWPEDLQVRQWPDGVQSPQF